MVGDTLSGLNAQIVLSKRIASTLLCIALALFGIHTWLHKSLAHESPECGRRLRVME